MLRMNALQILRRLRAGQAKRRRGGKIFLPARKNPVAPPVKGPILRPKQSRPANTTTCDIYRGANAPPGDPDVAGVPCALIANFREGSEASEGDQDLRFTHILLVDANVDIRDNYPNAPSDNDVFIPDKDGTGFEVVFVELVNRGQPGAYLRVFLDRKEPAWPTDQL